MKFPASAISLAGLTIAAIVAVTGSQLIASKLLQAAPGTDTSSLAPPECRVIPGYGDLDRQISQKLSDSGCAVVSMTDEFGEKPFNFTRDGEGRVVPVGGKEALALHLAGLAAGERQAMADAAAARRSGKR